MKPFVVVQHPPLPDEVRTSLSQAFQLIEIPVGTQWNDVIAPDQRGLVEGALCVPMQPVNAALLEHYPNLRIYANRAVGFDNVDVPAATQRGVLVCNTPGVLDASVADLTLGLILSLARQIPAGDAYVRAGLWRQRGPAPLGASLDGKILGLLGMGRIGRAVAQRARAFGMEVLYCNRSRYPDIEESGLARFVERDELFQCADFISLHLPLTPASRGGVGAREFQLMKPSAYLINTARGAVVDEAALIQALQSGEIAGAGLDVMEKEPIDENHPLCALSNVILQSHAGSATHETRRAMLDLAVDNLIKGMSGERPLAMVNPEVWPPVRRSA